MKSWERRLAIILPSFNESKNLRQLLRKIKMLYPKCYIFIVDDSSAGENKIIKKIGKQYKKVTVITREKKLGRGSAVFDGFEQAIKNKNTFYFIEMDTDLAHDPKEISLFYEKIKEKNIQLVVGSRYNKKSKIVNWPMKRLILSRLINIFLNLLFGLHIHDYTNGYRMYTRKAILYLVKKRINEKNFIALSESAFLLKQKGYAIAEVPITFTDRKHGASTVGLAELFACLMGAFRIRINNKK